MRADQQPPLPRDWSRRDFGRAVVGATAVAYVGLGAAMPAEAADDSPLARFCRSLSPDQRQALLLPGDDPRRVMVQNNWAVVPATIADLTAAQQSLALDLIRQACTPAGFARLTRQRDDDSAGWKHDHLAIFGPVGEPDRCEWVLTGRHLTLRGSASGAITGGPLFLGHSADTPAGIWADQAEAARSLFRALDAQQRGEALAAGGLDLGGVSPDQRTLARSLLGTLTAPFRVFEVASVQSCLIPSSPFGGVRWQAFGTDGDELGPWRLVGPGFAWSFHDAPHVHSWFDSA